MPNLVAESGGTGWKETGVRPLGVLFSVLFGVLGVVFCLTGVGGGGVGDGVERRLAGGLERPLEDAGVAGATSFGFEGAFDSSVSSYVVFMKS